MLNNIFFHFIIAKVGESMKKIKEVIIVEGKTDTQVLKELFDVETIETHGLALSDKTLDYIKKVNEIRGVIVLTDPDFPGMKIRNMIKEILPTSKHAFVNKKDAVGDKKLGIAEARKEAIIEALENVVSFDEMKESISWEEFIGLDIIGNKQKRLKIYEYFHLGYGNVKTLFKRLNMVGITKQDIEKIL